MSHSPAFTLNQLFVTLILFPVTALTVIIIVSIGFSVFTTAEI
jgi:hypothetical protein